MTNKEQVRLGAMKRWPLAIAVLVWSLTGHAGHGSALADGRASRPAMISAQPLDCDCRAMGRIWRQGEEICLDGVARVCGMDQNVSSWIVTGNSCPLARFMRIGSPLQP